MANKKLDFTGCETYTTDTYYDIMNGYYTKEIKCPETVKKLEEAIETIQALEKFLQKKNLIG